MTRNNRAKSSNTTSPSPTAMKNTFIDLPDLSKFQDEEKRHILDVLERDENLRNQHLLRFMNLRKEVTDLEQQSHPTSASVCARCQTPFGFIFNTGDDCPKCGAKVCKQCRLLHNDHDNGWLCQLCCKQMQLMSYSGEWLYTASNRPKKNLETSWDAKRETYHRSVSARNSNIDSSSDSEPEILNIASNPVSRFAALAPPTKESKPKPAGSNSKINKMLVQSQIDEQKLDFVRDHLRRRPKDISFTQPLPRRVIKLPSTSNTVHSSVEEVNSIQSAQVPTPKKQNLTVSKEVKAVISLPNETSKDSSKNEEIDRKSIVSTENVDPSKKSKRNRLKLRVSRQQSTNDSKLSLESITTEKSSHRNLSASMQNLRDTVHRITPSQLLSSRTASSSKRDHLSVSSNMPSGKDDEDTISVKMSETTNKTRGPGSIPGVGI
ncbi:unnamed protein product [Adineta ricciae]|uniref:RabBD domain-containing protein n=1 Tax=Adineta ricciae TaxID=249248 RepID=A0A815L9W1_ADIRI|nr:unnamed protein product [Adineta ricciae]